jgi:hypothetical protein
MNSEGATMQDAKVSEPKRYALRVESWGPRASRVVERSLDDLCEHIRNELDGTSEGEEVVFSVIIRRVSDAEMDALPEWQGP